MQPEKRLLNLMTKIGTINDKFLLEKTNKQEEYMKEVKKTLSCIILYQNKIYHIYIYDILI